MLTQAKTRAGNTLKALYGAVAMVREMIFGGTYRALRYEDTETGNWFMDKGQVSQKKGGAQEMEMNRRDFFRLAGTSLQTLGLVGVVAATSIASTTARLFPVSDEHGKIVKELIK